MAFNPPKAFLFTFVPYGTRLHGDERGSVNKFHNRYGDEFVPPNPQFEAMRRADLVEEPLLISPAMRGVLEDTIRQHCEHRSWHHHSSNVRTNHIHAVLAAASEAERMLTDLKAYLTRALRRAGLIDGRERVWAQGGSMRYLFTDESVKRACEYVYLGQGADLPRE